MKCEMHEGYFPEDVACVPMEGQWLCVDDISKISGLSHGVGGCPPHQGACKLTLNVKNGIIVDVLIETVGCSGIAQSAVIASEFLVGKNLLEALNTHLVCDAINVAMKNAFTQFVYGRTQTAFSASGVPCGSLCGELADNQMSHVGTVAATLGQPPKLLQATEGYITSAALDESQEIIGYQYVRIGKLLADIQHGRFTRIEDYQDVYGRYNDGVKFVDPRRENDAV